MNWVSFGLDCFVALLGGCLGASISGLGGFVLFGFLGLLGILYLLAAHNDVWIHAVTASVLLSPNVCFMGGVFAAAYARKNGLIKCGKDIGRSFVSFRRPDVLAAGALGGLLGYLVNLGIAMMFAGKVDTIAFTVFLVPLCLKRVWGLTRSSDCEAASHAVPSPFRFFERFSRPRAKAFTSVLVGLCASLMTVGLYLVPATKAYAGAVFFFVSAVSLFPLFMGIPVPATHHFSGPAGAVVLLWLSSQAGIPTGWGIGLVVLWGVAAAQIGLLSARVMERLFFTNGDVHIDPPAMGILCATAIMLGGLPLTGVYRFPWHWQGVVCAAIVVGALIANLRDDGPQSQPEKEFR